MKKLELQAVLFDKKSYDPLIARHYLKINHINRLKKVHQTTDYLRYRVRDPDDFDKDSFRTVQIGKDIKYIMGKLL